MKIKSNDCIHFLICQDSKSGKCQYCGSFEPVEAKKLKEGGQLKTSCDNVTGGKNNG